MWTPLVPMKVSFLEGGVLISWVKMYENCTRGKKRCPYFRGALYEGFHPHIGVSFVYYRSLSTIILCVHYTVGNSCKVALEQDVEAGHIMSLYNLVSSVEIHYTTPRVYVD